jgi:hypothetical protein
MRIFNEPVSHLCYLIDYVLKTDGPVLELGIGIGSTPVLHELCRKRKLVSYESVPAWHDKFRYFRSDWHEMFLMEDWDNFNDLRHWSLAFVDNDPVPKRADNIMKLKDCADIILLHDTERRHERRFHFSDLADKFKYQIRYDAYIPNTTAMSDRIDLLKF